MSAKIKEDGVESRVSSFDETEGSDDVNAPKRKFGTLSMMGLAANLMVTWEALGAVLGAALISGGPVGLVWGFLLVWIGVVVTALSLSEMASMYPMAGGQYHFVAALAPKSLRKPLSYFSGSITVFGWISLSAAAPFLGGVILQGLLVFNLPDYQFERYHGTFLFWGFLLIAALINIFLTDSLPVIQHATLALHLSLWLVFVVVLLVKAPSYQPASFVFTEFLNYSGWDNSGVAWSIGLLSSIGSIIGYDATLHMCEELRNPSRAIPKAMIGGVMINGVLGFSFAIVILFCIQNLSISVLKTPTAFPIIPIIAQVVGKTGATALVSCILLVGELATVPCMAAASRMMWAFARDGGLPFSQTLSKLHGKQKVPRNAIITNVILLAALGCLNIGSSVAWNAILSLAIVAIYISYLIPVALMLWRRLWTPERIEYGPFRLGRFGIPCNIFCVVYSVYTGIFLLFPAYQPVTAMTFNYSPIVLAAILFFTAVWYLVRGRHDFKGLGANEVDDLLTENPHLQEEPSMEASYETSLSKAEASRRV